MARKPGETTADVRARKERRAVAPKFASSAPRPGSVAANREAGTNKAAVNQAAKASGTFTGNVGKTPSSSPSPSRPGPSPSPAPSNNYSAKQVSNAQNHARRFAAGKVKENKKMMKIANDVGAPNKSKSNPFTGTNKYGDPIGTGYQGGNPTFYLGPDESYTGKDGTVTKKPTSTGGSTWDGKKSTWGATGYIDIRDAGKAPTGLKAGDQYFDPSKFGTKGPGGDVYSGVTGRVAYVTKEGYAMPEFNNSGANKNWDLYAAPGTERMSSEGLYQSKYGVGEREGFEGYNFAGGEQHSNNRTGAGIIDDYFKRSQSGETSFERDYASYVGDGRKEGYAGDVLKLADQGHLKLTDDQYNRAVVDAQNYDWADRGREEGQMSGKSSRFDAYDSDYSYDIRSGGLNQNKANATYASNNGMHHQVNEDRARFDAVVAQNMTEMEPTPTPSPSPDKSASTTPVPNPNTASITPPENNYNNYDWEAQMSAAQTSFNPYKSNNKPSYSSNMNFNFNPYKFQQGQ